MIHKSKTFRDNYRTEGLINSFILI